MHLALSKSEIKNLAMEITAKTYENDVDVNIGNKYFLTTMRSSDDLEVKKWVQEVKKNIRQAQKAGRCCWSQCLSQHRLCQLQIL